MGDSDLVDLCLRAHVELDESRLVQLLPQLHLQPKVVVEVEAHLVICAVEVVVRVVHVVGGHEAVRAHLVAGVHSSQQHRGPRRRTVHVGDPLKGSRPEEPVSEITDEIRMIHL